MRAIEAAEVAAERAADQVELTSARLELTAVGDVEVHVDGEPVGLEAGATWSSTIGAPTDIELPGLLTARVVPGATGGGHPGQTRCGPRGSGGCTGEGRGRGRRRPHASSTSGVAS